jgi:hypothetical protein
MQVKDLLLGGLPHYLPANWAIESIGMPSEAKWPLDAVHAFLQAQLAAYPALKAYDVLLCAHNAMEPEYALADERSIQTMPTPIDVNQVGVRLYYLRTESQVLLPVFSEIAAGLLACRL